MPKVKYSQLVECLVQPNTTGGQQFYFSDIPQLRGKQIVGIEAYNIQDVTTSPITPGAAIISADQMKQAFLTLNLTTSDNKTDIGEQINKIPLTTLHVVELNSTAVSSPFSRDRLTMQNYIVSWDKSYVTVATPGITTGGAPVAFLFNVYYI